MTIYQIDPASVHQGQFVLLVMFCVTAALVALAFSLRGWQVWWLLLIIIGIVPALVVVTFAGADDILPFESFFIDVLLPLSATIGLASFVSGTFLGWILSKATKSLKQ